MKKAILFFLIFISVLINVSAQDKNISEGLELMQQKKFADAEVKFKENVSKHPDDLRGWMLLGSAQMNQEKYAHAIESFKKIPQADVKRAVFKNESYFRLAACYASLKDEPNSLKYLTMLADNAGGYNYARRLENDKVFEIIKNNPSLVNIKESLKKNSSPCLYDVNYKKLDFFIGTWDVFVQSSAGKYDRKVGSDSVVRSEGGCSLLEFFTYFQSPQQGIPDFKGKSMSFFDPAKQKFMHCWAGSSGDIFNYEAISDSTNTITFLAIANFPVDGLIHRRFKFTYHSEDGSLHQFIENSFDLGKTWQTDWNAMFIKNK